MEEELEIPRIPLCFLRLGSLMLPASGSPDPEALHDVTRLVKALKRMVDGQLKEQT